VIRTGPVILLACLVLAPPALAQRGVFVDPDSPAGKEYALPLEEARRHGAGGGAPGAGQPLFCAGIERAGAAAASSEAGPGSGGAGGSGSGGGDGKARGGGEAGNGASSGAGGGDEAVQRSAAVKAAAGGSSDGLMTAAIVALVLVTGLLAGVALRRTLGKE
jgi:hypothetical protein